MANRYVYYIDNQSLKFMKENITFRWYPGFAKKQKQKSVVSLHEAFLSCFPTSTLLEVSSKSTNSVGVQASAFNLSIQTVKGHTFTVEQLFQSSKVYKKAGRHNYMLRDGYTSREMKLKLKQVDSNDVMISYHCFGRDFKLEPKTLFYNWLYVNALTQNEKIANEILKYDAFTDIEFNPKRSYNCQAEACSIYVSLVKRGLLNKALENLESFESIVYGEVERN
ncbi:DarT1-associated NADAR antitoxin family protein [Staphylococcus simulans]|uniref:DarT1-associated NADAR antitoxin family protein n=1 Tax=Staphylococcus simulans TaxID=1286 RepID=UPI000D026285|nr:hypothetical protein [Staphylococcus simulans]